MKTQQCLAGLCAGLCDCAGAAYHWTKRKTRWKLVVGNVTTWLAASTSGATSVLVIVMSQWQAGAELRRADAVETLWDVRRLQVGELEEAGRNFRGAAKRRPVAEGQCRIRRAKNRARRIRRVGKAELKRAVRQLDHIG